jgi:hypothetical protein
VVLFLISQILFFRITGFEELGNTDSFQTNVLEKRFGETGTFPLFKLLQTNVSNCQNNAQMNQV